ncbi:hypothetical protein LTR08_002112 [Meristemomyces frigidus]|nr:hypothetical protein LTR08_002112 [Meristemomyces frigidus]
MRFTGPLFSAAVFGAAVHAAASPPNNRWNRGGVPSQIEKLEQEIERLEHNLGHDRSELESKQHHGARPQPYQPVESLASSSAVFSSAPVSTDSSAVVRSLTQSGSPSSSAASVSAASLASSLYPYADLTSSITLPSASSAASANASSLLASLSSVAASLSSVASSVSSVNATLTTTLASAYSSSASISTTSQTSTTTPVSSGLSSYIPGPSSSLIDSTSLINSTAVISTASSTFTASGIALASGNASSAFPTAPAGSAHSSSVLTPTKIVTANSTSALLSGTATMAPTPQATGVSSNITSSSTCVDLCSSLSFSSDLTVTPYICQAYAAGDTITVTGGQADVACGTTEVAPVDLCRVTLEITTSFASATFMEVWLPNGNSTSWNGRTLSTDNGGLSGCVAYDQLAYVSGKGFAAFGDNGGHNSSAFDGTAFSNNNENVLDWAWRGRHESVVAGKDVVKQFYGEEQTYAYYIGCSTGGQQGLHSAQYFPEDFDGIIAGSSAADFNHLEDWSARFIEMTGNTTDERFLTEDQWIIVQSYIFAQCDAALDGVDDGILEDPTQCVFDSSAIPICNSTVTDNCLTSTQVSTVDNVFTELYNADGELLYPQLLYGSQVDAFRLGQLSGTVQGIAHDWFAYGVYNNSDFDVSTVGQTDYTLADSLDVYHGNVSSFNGDLSAFRAAGKKLIMYHGMADPLVSGGNSQRYYLKVADTLAIGNTEMDDFMRYFRISGMAHCGVGGISGAGAWMFGQTGASALEGVADNIIDNLVSWVENDDAPDTIVGTKFWYDEPTLGLEFERAHCRFPYRTTWDGVNDSTLASSWGCSFIDEWQTCAVGAHPRLCNADGTFT